MSTQNEQDDHSAEVGLGINSGYVIGRLHRALATGRDHENPEVRSRAGRKAANWVKVVKGLLSGDLRIGTRTPARGVPTWATLQVVHGGFATGDLLAGGEAQPHEKALAARFANLSATNFRALLNSFYLSDAGIAELAGMLRSGCYRVNVPEEGALLAVAWLLEHDFGAAAREVLGQVGPYLDRLRFYPVPHPHPLAETSNVHIQTVRQTIQNLQAIRVPRKFQAQQESALVWAHLYDRAVELFLETVEGELPMLETGSDGKPVRRSTGGFSVTGGWPCQNYPDGWVERTRALLEDYRRSRRDHQVCGKPERQGENFSTLRRYLATCIADPMRLSGRDVGRIRSVLAHIAQRRGYPNSVRCRGLREFQASLANRPTCTDAARVVIARLSKLPQEAGLENLEEALAPIVQSEAPNCDLNIITAMAARLAGKVRRCLSAPIEVLVEQKVLTSSEAITVVLPQVTAQISAAGLPDPDLQRLYRSVYQAFRRRRSLLLLNLQSQVKLTELPWMKSIVSQSRDSTAERAASLDMLKQVVTLAVTAFPYQILPNKLLQVLRALCATADLRLPIVDEVAADIFMGTFSEKYLLAAKIAGKLLAGSLYERYYGLDYACIAEINDLTPSRFGGTPTSPAFARICTDLAGPAGGGSRVARNGQIIEQEQILTTHNLAALFTALNLTVELQARLPELAQACFTSICRRLQQKAPHWQARLQMAKNAAYAWRQMVFFLSLTDEHTQRAFVSWAADHLAEQRPEFRERFRPALTGLSTAVEGLPPDEPTLLREAARSHRFLGWTTRHHWLLE